MKKYTLFLALLTTQVAQAKLVDKVLAIFNSKVLTLSQIERITTNLPARKNVSPQIYNKDKMSDKDIVNLIIRNNMIREKLVAIGYNVTD
jgi:hypothetical protein